jgi:hypothetical protein
MVLTGMGIALVFVATLFINLRLPIGQGGLIHLGNVPLFLPIRPKPEISAPILSARMKIRRPLKSILFIEK